jgi:hypothetical protein
VLTLLVAIDVGLNLIEPFHRFVGEDMMADLRYPLKSNTVPVWAVPVHLSIQPFPCRRPRKLFRWIKDRCFEIGQIYAVIGPIIIIVGIYMKRRNVYDMHHAILGEFSTVASACFSSSSSVCFRVLTWACCG